VTRPDKRKPVLFVDVDGVISLFGFDPDAGPQGNFHWVNGVLHFISLGCGERLLRLPSRYELVWATGWEETANDYLPHLLGLPGPLPVVSFARPARFGTAHWKVDAIDDYAGPTRALAWVDDCHDDSCRAWADARPAPTLLIPTCSEQGLCDEHVDRLIAWADGLPERQGRP
jgi:Swiss Army Knife RNA repair-like protein